MLFRFCVGILSGLVAGDWATFYPCSTAAIGLISCGLWIRKHRFDPSTGFVPVVALLIGWMVSMVSASSRYDLPDTSAEAAVGRIDEVLGRTDGFALFTLDRVTIIQGGQEAGLEGRLRLKIRGEHPSLAPGDKVRVEARIRPPTGFMNPGGFDYGAYLYRRGISAVASVSRPDRLALLETGRPSIRRGIEAARGRVRSAFLAALRPKTSPLLQALVIGDDSQISPAVRRAFMVSGTVHILSVSGSHLALVSLIIFGGVRFFLVRLPMGFYLRLQRRVTASQIAAVATGGVALGYTLLAGAELATVRSLIMLAIYLLAVLTGRERESLSAVGLAAILIGLFDPAAVFDVSFQLSFSAVLGLVLVAQRMFPEPNGETISTPIEKLKRWWIAALAATVAANLATLPLVAHHFNQIAWVGLFANFVVTPIIGGLLVPMGLLTAVWVLLGGGIAPLWAEMIHGVAEAAMGLVSFFESWPGAAVYVPSPPPILIGLAYFVMVAAVTQAWRVRRIVVAAAVFGIVLIAWSLSFFMPDGRLEVAFLDVGQGDAAVVRLPDGKSILIDGGVLVDRFDAGRLAVAPYLWDQGVRRIDLVVGTHMQADHLGGLGSILSEFPVGRVITNGERPEAEFYRRFAAAAAAKGVALDIPEKDELLLSGGGAEVRLLRPSWDRAVGENDRSLVLRLTYGEVSILFTGDIEGPAQRALVAGDYALGSTILKVPHHGSKSSLDPKFLTAVQPRIAVISVGPANPYGHPSAQTLEAYRLLGSRLYRTDRDGAVLMRTDGHTIEIQTARDLLPEPALGAAHPLRTEWSNLKKRPPGALGLSAVF